MGGVPVELVVGEEGEVFWPCSQEFLWHPVVANACPVHGPAEQGCCLDASRGQGDRVDHGFHATRRERLQDGGPAGAFGPAWFG